MMHKRGVFASLSLAAAFAATSGPTEAKQPLSYIVVDAQSGQILEGQNIRLPSYPASTAKLATDAVIFAADTRGRINLNSGTLTYSQNAVNQGQIFRSINCGIKSGSTHSALETHIKFNVASCNDSATAIAEYVGRTSDIKAGTYMQQFVAEMNAQAKAFGMIQTRWMNPSGLGNPLQKTTVLDMTILMRHIQYDYAPYYNLLGVQRFWKDNDWKNNHLPHLQRDYSAHGFVVDGGKTGRLDAAGWNAVASATDGQFRLIVAVFGGATKEHRNGLMEELLIRNFNHLRNVGLAGAPNLGSIGPAYATLPPIDRPDMQWAVDPSSYVRPEHLAWNNRPASTFMQPAPPLPETPFSWANMTPDKPPYRLIDAQFTQDLTSDSRLANPFGGATRMDLFNVPIHTLPMPANRNKSPDDFGVLPGGAGSGASLAPR